MTSPDRDRQMAELSLYMDPKERANLMVEHERWERRKRAMKRGDEGSPIPNSTECECGPLTFAPIQCSGCGIKLTTQNHGHSEQCARCWQEVQALNFERVRAEYLAKMNGKAARAFWPMMGWATLLVIGACAAGKLLPILWDKVAFWLGGMLP